MCRLKFKTPELELCLSQVSLRKVPHPLVDVCCFHWPWCSFPRKLLAPSRMQTSGSSRTSKCLVTTCAWNTTHMQSSRRPLPVLRPRQARTHPLPLPLAPRASCRTRRCWRWHEVPGSTRRLKCGSAVLHAVAMCYYLV